MILRLVQCSHRFFSSVIISKSNNMNINKCYFRHIQQEDKVDISFLLDIKGSSRQFNLSRNASETLEVFLCRIKTNVLKVINKSNKKKKNNDANSEDFPIELYNVEDKIIDRSSSCMQLFSMRPVKLKMLDKTFEVVFNPPWVVNINLPQTILAGFPVYPEYLEMQNSTLNKCIFNWYTGDVDNAKGKELAEQHMKWNLTYNGYAYTPRTDDIGKKVKLECIPGNDEMKGPAVETISKNVIEAGPGKCPFENRQVFCQQRLKDKSFRCVTYNILADLYCDSDHTRAVLHPYCPPYALHIDYRKHLFIKELVGYNSDIMCLQEVDRKIFIHWVKPILKTDGMDGVFYQKAKDIAEGLACFYREDRFKLIGDERIVLSEAVQKKTYLQTIWNKIKDNEPLRERLLDRSTVASATFLQSIENPNEVLIVANTHLYFHPDADHIRLIQGGIIIYWLMHLQKSIIAKHPGKRVSVVLCGDFNSVPSCGIYQLYTTGKSPSTLPDWKSNINEAVSDLNLEQNIILDSACGTPLYTNYTAEFQDCLDYIYYDLSNLEVEQVIPLPSVEELKLHTALPSVVFPSDHVALISDLRFK